MVREAFKQIDTATTDTACHIVWQGKGLRTNDGAGVTLSRVIGTAALPDLDPFLMLDEFGSDDPAAYIRGFP